MDWTFCFFPLYFDCSVAVSSSGFDAMKCFFVRAQCSCNWKLLLYSALLYSYESVPDKTIVLIPTLRDKQRFHHLIVSKLGLFEIWVHWLFKNYRSSQSKREISGTDCFLAKNNLQAGCQNSKNYACCRTKYEWTLHSLDVLTFEVSSAHCWLCVTQNTRIAAILVDPHLWDKYENTIPWQTAQITMVMRLAKCLTKIHPQCRVLNIQSGTNLDQKENLLITFWK